MLLENDFEEWMSKLFLFKNMQNFVSGTLIMMNFVSRTFNYVQYCI